MKTRLVLAQAYSVKLAATDPNKPIAESLSKALGLVIFAGAICSFPVTVLADCSETKVYSLYKKGVEVEEIADKCDMDEDDVQAIIDKKKAQGGRAKPERRGSGASQPDSTTQPRQPFCCDGSGNSRCAIVAGSTQLGSSCFCPGQGYGVICR
jgi:hypothetical protein